MALNTHVEAFRAVNGALVEIGTIEHEGHKFTAHGAIIDIENGYAVAYVSDDGHRLTNWGSTEIGTCATVSTWQRWSWYGLYTMRSIRASLKDDPEGEWYGRYNTEFQAVTLRRRKKANA